MSGVLIHSVFDVLAWLAAGAAAVWLARVEKISFPAATSDLSYIAAVLLGAGVGAYLFGTANLWLSGVSGLGRSIVAVGRIGCFVSGIDDFTHGTPTALPWGYDFGDGVARHPVQLYESAAMAAFAIFYLIAVRRRDAFVIENGFYLAVGWYGAQRFAWEFIKPYGAVLGPFTLFHLLSAAVLVYAAAMIASAPQRNASHDRAAA